MAQHLQTGHDHTRQLDRERQQRRPEQERSERRIERAQVELLALIAEVGLRSAVVLLNDALRTALDLAGR